MAPPFIEITWQSIFSGFIAYYIGNRLWPSANDPTFKTEKINGWLKGAKQFVPDHHIMRVGYRNPKIDGIIRDVNLRYHLQKNTYLLSLDFSSHKDQNEFDWKLSSSMLTSHDFIVDSSISSMRLESHDIGRIFELLCETNQIDPDFYQVMDDITHELYSFMPKSTSSILRLSKPLSLLERLSMPLLLKNEMIVPNLKSLMNDITEQFFYEREDNEQSIAICNKIILMNNENPNFKSIFESMNPGLITPTNAHQLKKYLSRKHYDHYFYFTQSSRYKSEYFKILFELIPQQIKDKHEIFDCNFPWDLETVEKCRKDLFNEIKPDSRLSESSIIYTALMILSKYWPLNDESIFTFEPIPDQDRVFTMSGHHFNVKELMDFNKSRPAINPYTNISFEYFDRFHIANISVGIVADSLLFHFREKFCKNTKREIKDKPKESIMLKCQI